MIKTLNVSVGDKVICINNKPLTGNETAPELVIGNEYTIKAVTYDSQNNPHLDVGLKSSLNYVRSYETEEKLPDGDKIHWCHPSRFEKGFLIK